MRIKDFDVEDGAIVVRHGMGTKDVSVWVERPDGVEVAPFMAVALDDDRVEVQPIAGVPVAAIVVKGPNESAGRGPR